MELVIVAIYDRQLQSYMAPWTAPTPGAAVRAFSDVVNENGHAMNKHPEDYELHKLGTWDDQTGKYQQPDEIHEVLQLGHNIKR